MSARGEKIIGSVRIVGACTGFSRLLGLVREILMANLFGTSLAKSAFDVAFCIPNLFRRLFGEGALSAAFVPVFTSSLESEGLEAASRLANRVMGMLTTVLGVLVVGGIVSITLFLHVAIPGERLAAVLPLLQIMLPYTLFICMASLCMAILNSFHDFAVPAAAPVVLNVVWIAVLVFICPHIGDTAAERITVVAWGIVVAGVAQFAIHLPVLHRHGVRLRLSLHWRDPHVYRILALMGPAALGMGVMQLNVVMDKMLALFAGPWAPAALTYSERLIYLPLGLFATAMGTVLLPAFSRQAARGEHEKMARTLETSTQSLMLIVIPAALGLLLLAEPIVRLTFEWKRGAFGDDSTVYTVRALWFYSAGLIPFSFYKLIVPVYYALQDTRTPVRVGIQMAGLNLALNILFVLTWPAGYGHAGLACATVISSVTNCWILTRRMSGCLGGVQWSETVRVLLRIVLASLAMGLVVVYTAEFLRGALEPLPFARKLQQLVAVLLSIALGMAVYGAIVWMMCRPALRRLFRR